MENDLISLIIQRKPTKVNYCSLSSLPYKRCIAGSLGVRVGGLGVGIVTNRDFFNGIRLCVRLVAAFHYNSISSRCLKGQYNTTEYSIVYNKRILGKEKKTHEKTNWKIGLPINLVSLKFDRKNEGNCFQNHQKNKGDYQNFL